MLSSIKQAFTNALTPLLTRREVVRPRTDFQITQTWADAMRKMTTKRRRGLKWRRWRNARERVRLHYHRVPVEKIDG